MGKPRSLLTVQEAAQLLYVSKMTVYRRINEGQFTTINHPITGHTLIPREQVEALLQNGWTQSE